MKIAESDRRALRAERQRSERRDAIARAAERVFGKLGYHAASVTDVIDAAGISRGTFYLYFDGKDELFLELIERFIKLVTSALEVVDPSGNDPAQRILENVQRLVDVAFEHPELTRVVLRESRDLNPDIDEKLNRLYGFLDEMIEGALINGARTHLTRSVHPPVISTALIGAFKEVFLRNLPPATPSCSRQELAEALFQFGIRGLLATHGEER